jgi:cytochrome b561
MTAKSTTHRYGNVAIIIHWLSAALILALMGSGFRASDLGESDTKVAILQVHIPLGIAILLLTIARIGWWMFADRKPDSLPMASWQERSSRAVHILFYVVILGMAASGIGMMILSGAGSIIFDEASGALPDFWDYLPRRPHGIGVRFMIALFMLHVGAALYHQVIKKDGLIGRMWFSQ